MKVGIFENIMTPGGHEVDFDRILVEELKKRGHEVSFAVPEDFVFNFDYKVPVERLKGKTISYNKVKGLKKVFYSLKREINRQGWYSQLYDMLREKRWDALIVPTSTYRYLRAINKNILKKSPVPIIFVLHGINPKEAPKFFAEAEKLRKYTNIRLVVLTFNDHIFGRRMENVYTIYPPTYIARDIDFSPKLEKKDVLTIGFFGQYRREKKLRDFLEVYVKGQYKRPVRLLVQGSTMHPEDKEDFQRIIAEYSSYENISFLHKGLIGAEWQQALSEVDVLLMPYSAPRYLYHWGGMLFTAIGMEKPVILSDDINPEVLQAFNIGKTFKSGDLADLRHTLELFINNFDSNINEYAQNLSRAARLYAPEAFADRLERIIAGERPAL